MATSVLLPDDALARGFTTPIEALHLVYNKDAMPADLTAWDPDLSLADKVRHAYTTSEVLAAFLFVADGALARSIVIHGWSQEVLNAATGGSLPPELAPLATRDAMMATSSLLGRSVVMVGGGDEEGVFVSLDEEEAPATKRTRVVEGGAL